MKKILYPLALFFALTAFGSINAQNIKDRNVAKPNVEFVLDNDMVVRQNINRPINQLLVKGKSSVMVVYDSVNYIDAVFNPDEANPLDEKWIVVKGFNLIVDDPNGQAYYVIHLKKDELHSVKNSSGSIIIYVSLNNSASSDQETVDSETMDNGHNSTTSAAWSSNNMARQQQIEEARQQLEIARKNLAKLLNKTSDNVISKHDNITDGSVIITDTFYVDSTDDVIPLEPIDEIAEAMVDDYDSNNATDKKSQISIGNDYHPFDRYSFEDRAGTAFLWGFNNWGNNWYNGLGKMDGAYELRTSFSSWQLEFTYAVIMTRHFYLDLGFGYESDIYKFTTPLVDIDNNGIFQDRMTTYLNNNYNNQIANNQVFQNTNLNDWSSRFVTRYFSIPIDFVFRFNNEFKIGFSAIPALGFSSCHTGLKHEIDNRYLEHLDIENVSKFITPYKLDLRFSMRFGHFGFFAQVSTISLFKDKDVYPFKIGFIIK